MIPLLSTSVARRRAGQTALWLLLLGVIAVAVIYPVARLLEPAVRGGWSTVERVGDIPNIDATIRNTFVLGFASSALAVVLGVLLAWWTYRLPSVPRRVFAVVPLLPLAIPQVAVVVGWVFLLSPRVGYLNVLLRKLPWWSDLRQGPVDVYSRWGIVMVTGFALTSFVYAFVYAQLHSSSGDLEAAASVSGASSIRVFFTVTLPLLRPVIIYSTIMVLLLGLGQFAAPLLLGRTQGIDVVTTEMFRLRETPPLDYGMVAVLALPYLVFGAIVLLAQRRLIGEQARYGLHTGRATQSRLNTSWWGAIGTTLYALLAVVLPLLALLYVSVSPFWTGRLDFAGLTLRHFREVLFENPRAQDAIWTSVQSASIAVLIVVPIGFVAASALLSRSSAQRWVRGGLDVTTQMPLVLPAGLLGFGILFAYSRPPLQLYGTTAVIVLTYVTLMIPFAVRAALAPMISLGPGYFDASKVSGGGPVRTVTRVTLPMIRRGLAVGTAVIVILLFHEFSASLMVRSAKVQVMGTLLYEYWSGGVYPEVAVVALTMVVVTMAGVGVVLVLAGRQRTTEA